MSASGLGRALVVEPGPPNPEKDAGSRAIIDLVDGLCALGYQAALAVESRPGEMDELIAKKPELVVLSRPGTFLRNANKFDRSKTQLLYFPHDFHSARIRSGQAFQSHYSDRAAVAIEILERRCIANADNSLFPSEEEAQAARELCPGAHSSAINYYWFTTSSAAYIDRAPGGVIFVGSRNHAPNVDGVNWFLREMWSRISSTCPEAELALVGEWQDVVDAIGAKKVTVYESLSDEALDRLLEGSRLGISPLRFGAGMKRKTLHYLSGGLPVVSTSYGVQGLGDVLREHPAAIVADNANDFCDAVIGLISQPVRASDLSDDAKKLVLTHFNFERYLEKLFVALSQPKPKTYSID